MAEIVVVGANGMLGRAVSVALAARAEAFLRLGRPELDLCSQASVRDRIGPRTRLVVNCAAYTDVDAAEANEAEALRVNGRGPGLLAERCAEVGAVLVHYSTDYVFAGDASRPYAVDDAIAPVNAYGRTKAIGEARIRETGVEHLVLRTSWLYAPWGKNFVRTIARMCRAQELLRVVDDQRGRPTSAEQLAKTTLRLLDEGARGTFHATDGGECTWFGLAAEIAAVVRPSCRIEPCTSQEFPRPAPRPHYSVLDLTETERACGPLVPWQESLRSALSRIED